MRSVLWSLLTVLAGSLLVWWLLGRPATGIDDADIFLVYARHFADGHGFVYNMGGERVEGFTSLLWVLICAALFRVTDQIEVALYLVNVLIGTATVWICLRRVRRPVVFLLVLAAVPAWFAWCQVTLMESGLWCALLTLSVLAVVDRRIGRLSLILPLLVIARPESMLWGCWLILMLGVRVGSSDGWRRGLRVSIVPALTFFTALLGLVAFRMAYFGYPVPNTYYAKVSPNLGANLQNGAGYLFEYLSLNPAVLLLAVAAGWILIQSMVKRTAGQQSSAVIALCLLPGIFIPVLVGGDHFGGSRFYQPIWPLLCLLVVEAWPEQKSRIAPKRAYAVLLILLVCGWGLFPFTSRLAHEFRIAREGRATGQALSVMFGDLEAWPSVAVITAGGNKFTYPGPVYDLMGLNSTAMAHAPGERSGFKNHTAFNHDLFYTWNPDILLCGDSAEFDEWVLKGLPGEARFHQQYIKVTLQRNENNVTAYYSHLFMKKLHKSL
jgi:hypothetical protein